MYKELLIKKRFNPFNAIEQENKRRRVRLPQSRTVILFLNLNLNLYSISIIPFHFCMPSPLAPDPFRVQSCVWCLF